MASIRFLGIALLLAALPQLTSAAAARITVRNVPVQANALIDRGHILLPLRATFEALNSTVSYDRNTGSITARNILHVLHMHTGARSATLDGREIRLPLPPILQQGRVFVLLAFAAHAMGAIIQYDRRTNVIAVNGSEPNQSPTAQSARRRAWRT